jgi:hypothetical protein
MKYSAVNNIVTVAEQLTDKDSLNKGMSGGSRSVIDSTHCINEAILRPSSNDDNDVSEESFAVAHTIENLLHSSVSRLQR